MLLRLRSLNINNQPAKLVNSMTVEDLRKIWQPGSTVKTWKDVRSNWPASSLNLYGPGTDSGTFDYFTEAINGKSGACRPDFTASEDDNVLVQGIAGDKNGLGFFGFAYYVENKSRLKVIPIDGGDGPVEPTSTSINDSTYQPLSRPVFIYVSTAAAKRPEIREFVKFYLQEAPALVKEVGYVPLPDEAYSLAWKRFENGVTGSLFAGRSTVGVDLAKLLAQH